MASTTSGTWTAFYERNKDDNGAIQRLFRTNLTMFSVMSENHLNDTVRIMETVGGSNYGNMLLVPGTTGFMQVLHHGFTHSAELGGPMDIVAVHGNLSEASLKVIPKDTIVMQAGNNTGRRRSAIECPTMDSILGTTTAEEFRALAPAKNEILRQKPNHIFIGPDTFFLTKGAKQVRSSELAALIIDRFTIDADDDDQVAQAKLDEAGTAELLLSFLWASERNLLAPVTLTEPGESNVLNSIHRAMKARIAALSEVDDNDEDKHDDGESGEETQRGNRKSGFSGRGFMDDDDDDGIESEHFGTAGEERSEQEPRRKRGEPESNRFRDFTVTTAGIVDVMKQVELARQNERKKDAQEKSLLRHLGRSQRELFLVLSTSEMSVAPELTDFMSQLSKETSASKALQQVVNESKDWEGTFSHGGFHKFLSSGFVSQEQNRGNPGGFNLFMFHPRTVEMPGSSSFDAAKARLRDLFDAKVDDETIAHYSKQGLFAASNHHDMRVQLQTALDMLVLLVGPGSIATKGLAYVLEPKRWSRMSPLYHERFQAESLFGAKFIYCLDRSLQQFLRRLERPDERDSVGSADLLHRARELLSRIDEGYDVTVRLPAALQPIPVASGLNNAGASAPLALTEGAPTGTPAKKKRKVGAPGPAGEAGSQIVTNTSPYPAWKLPDGKRYADFFQGRTQSTQNWPVVPDTRLGNRSPAPLCIRFQATAACRRNCRLAHVSRTAIDPAVRRLVDDKFVAAYAPPETSTALVTT